MCLSLVTRVCVGCTLTKTTIMLNIPTIKIPLPAFDPKILFANLLQCIQKHPKLTLKADIGPHLHNFLADPIIKHILEDGKIPAIALEQTSHQVDLAEIHSALDALTKAVTDIRKKVDYPLNNKQQAPTTAQHAKGKSNSPIKSYAAIAGTRPPNPSLVVDLAGLELPTEGHPRPEEICELLNRKLGKVTPTQAQLAAARWTAKGNLVVMGTHTTTPTSLQTAAPYISSIISRTLQIAKDNTIPHTRANIRWSKITINGVPTGMSNTWAPYTPEECHKALAATNPIYASLSIMQLPSWVHPLTSYKSRTISSLSVAFEVQDGSKLKTLLDERYLYCFSSQASVKKWKQCRKSTKDNSSQQADQHTQGCNVQDSDDNEDIEIQLTQEPITETCCMPDASSFQFEYTTIPSSQLEFSFSNLPLAPERQPPNPPCNAKGKKTQWAF
jgi:hypothetical protein